MIGDPDTCGSRPPTLHAYLNDMSISCEPRPVQHHDTDAASMRQRAHRSYR